MFNLFLEGSVIWMTPLTLIFIALFMAAWKAPAWVKEIGRIGLAVGIFATLVGCFIAFKDIARAGDIPQWIMYEGLRIALITTLYGLLIYIVSLIILIIQKPRI